MIKTKFLIITGVVLISLTGCSITSERRPIEEPIVKSEVTTNTTESDWSWGSVVGEQLKSPTTVKNQILVNSGSKFVYTFQDNITGVWYIGTTGGMTPRLNPDGTLYVTPID